MRRLYIKDKDGNYVPAPIIRGDDGREISLRATNTHIQWKYDDTEWTNLIALSELKGKQGDKGAVGAHFTPSVSDDGVLSWTNNGGLGNPQPVNIRGPQGVQGEQGRGLTILGYYNTLAILQSSVLAPNGGDAYGVGTTSPYEIYIWDAVNGQWKPNGKLSGPNEVTSSTATNLTGLLKGNGTNVKAAVSGVDYATPNNVSTAVANHNNSDSAHSELFVGKQNAPAFATALSTSGTALTANTLYNVSAAVGTYSFKAPATGWAHGIFTTGTTPNITFTGKSIAKLPTFKSNKKYEFDVYNGAWIVQEVVTQ